MLQLTDLMPAGRFSRLCAALALLALVTAGCSGDADIAPTAEGAEVVPGSGVAAPSFEGDLLTGGRLTLDSLRGQPVIVNFWATTCAPCIREMPALAGAAREHSEEGLVVLGVNYGESVNMIEKFLDSFEIDLGFPIVLDDGGEIGRLFRVVVFPTTYFIDRDGVIQYRRLGELGESHLVEGLARIV